MKLRPRRPRYADVVATLALFMALGGSAAALPANTMGTVAPPNSVNTAAIQGLAVTTPKLANEAVTSAKITPDSVNGSKVADHSLTLADLAGTSQTGAISFTLPAHGCGYLTMSVSGARTGELATLAWTGTGNPPLGVMVGPLKVVSAGKVVASACNLTAHQIVGQNLRVRVVALK